MTLTVIHERYPYRYVDSGILENGFPDYRIQKYNEVSGRYKDMYLCDNGDQLETAMEDFEYTKWLDPADVPCYNQSKQKKHSKIMAAKGTAAKSASGASMSKYDVEVEARLVALEAAVEELKSHTHSGGSDERVDKIIAHMAKKEDIGDIF